MGLHDTRLLNGDVSGFEKDGCRDVDADVEVDEKRTRFHVRQELTCFNLTQNSRSFWEVYCLNLPEFININLQVNNHFQYATTLSVEE